MGVASLDVLCKAKGEVWEVVDDVQWNTATIVGRESDDSSRFRLLHLQTHCYNLYEGEMVRGDREGGREGVGGHTGQERGGVVLCTYFTVIGKLKHSVVRFLVVERL